MRPPGIRRPVETVVLRCLPSAICQQLSPRGNEFVGDFHDGLFRIFVGRLVLSNRFFLALTLVVGKDSLNTIFVPTWWKLFLFHLPPRRRSLRLYATNGLPLSSKAVMTVMEQRGTGFARMREAMLNHGLDEPRIDQQDGFFVVALPGPAGNYDHIRTPANAPGLITPAVEVQLNERQKKIMVEVQQTGFVTSGWCRKRLPVVYDTIRRDLLGLMELGVLQPQGKGRNTRYVLEVNRE